MLDQALLVLGRIDLPDLLEADAEFRWLAFGIEGKFRDQLLGQAAARPFREKGVFAEQFHAARERGLVRTVLGDTHVAGRYAAHRALLIVEHFGRGEARINLDTQRLGLRRQPATDTAERTDIAMMIVN